MSEVQQFLAEYAKAGSETAFREVVSRYVDLVHSTALRLVDGDLHLAEDVAQTVFTDLAKMAGALSKEVMVGGWLHRHTCFVARKAMRKERRRQARELEASKMNETEDHSNIRALAPVLDEAINQLGAPDRQAIVLRFFEQRDFRSVGEAIGSNEEAARKRVNRALDKLRDLLKRRGVSLSATALATTLGAHAVTAAPVGLVTLISVSALASAAAGGGTALTLLHIMSMTKAQGAVIAAITLALSIPIVMQHHTQTKLREENESLRAQVQEVAALTAENKRLSNVLATGQQPGVPRNNEQQRELLKLRGEVGVLRRTANEPGPSALSSITANPETSKMIRDQQKFGLGMIYKDFGKRANLPAEKLEELNNLLADDVMTNINHITVVLGEGKSPEQMDAVFAQQEMDLQEKVETLLGPEAFAQFQDYNRNLASFLTAEQFKSLLSGDKQAKEAQTKQLYEMMQQETRKVLASHGLTEDYQLVPTLNFRNFASEQEGDKNLQLLDSIYAQVQASAGSFLSAEELEKFGEFRKKAIDNNRTALILNRKLMGPAAK